MWWISVRDVQWRRRRYAIAVVGAAMVFALALAIAGISNGFRVEASNMVEDVRADGFVMNADAAGPFTSVSALPTDAAAAVAATPGVRRADPLVMIRSAAQGRAVLVVGHVPGGLGTPDVKRGRPARTPLEAVVDGRFGAGVGDRITFGGADLRVVGTTSGNTVNAGMPALYVTLERAQAAGFGGRELATAIVVEGRPEALPPGTRLLSPADARADALSPLKDSVEAIDIFRVLLWIVAAVIIGSIIYLSALERVRDFAVLKAVGAGSRALVTGLLIQSVLLSIIASALAIALVQPFVPLFPLPVAISRGALLLLPAIAVVVGVLAALAGVRRAVSADPAMAFAAA